MTGKAFNPSDKHSGITLTESNRHASTGTGWVGVRGFAFEGKAYWELRRTGGTHIAFGVASANNSISPQDAILGSEIVVHRSDGHVYHNGEVTQTGIGYGGGDRIGVAVDTLARKIWFAKNNVWSGSPVEGTGGWGIAWEGSVFPYAALYLASGRIYTDPEMEELYAPPSGFVALDGVPPPPDFGYWGVVRDKTGTPAQRTVRAIRDSDDARVATVNSDPITGAYEFITTDEAHTLIFGGEPDRNDLIFKGVLPAELPGDP